MEEPRVESAKDNLGGPADEATPVAGSALSNPPLPNETCIVFDWDDTLLPTTWLERRRVLHSAAALRPQLMRALTNLSEAVSRTLDAAEKLGTVIIVTNAAHGWVEASVQQFMPALAPRVLKYSVYAKPLRALVTTWKVEAFRRECGNYGCVVSLGDGPVERQACLRLAMQMRVKSLKFAEMPDVSQLLSTHELVCARIQEITHHVNDLDLRVAVGMGTENGAAPNASLVHLTRLTQRPRGASVGPGLPRLLDSGARSPVTVARTPQRTVKSAHASVREVSPSTPTKSPSPLSRPFEARGLMSPGRKATLQR
jgi:hypothetical protein